MFGLVRIPSERCDVKLFLNVRWIRSRAAQSAEEPTLDETDATGTIE